MFDIQKSIEEKQKLAEEVAQKSLMYENLILEFVTGSGKTAALLKSIKCSPSKKKWLILVPEIALIQNFKDDAVKNGYNDILQEKIEDIICYASLHKYKGASLNLGMDEGHNATSDLRVDLLSEISSDQRILLSATLNRDLKIALSKICKWHNLKLTLNQAIERGILPEPDIRIIRTTLNDVDKVHPYKFRSKEVKLTAKDYYVKLTDSISYWSNQKEEGKVWANGKLQSAIFKRKRFIAEYKTELAKKLLTKIQDKRFICFCGTVDQAIALGENRAIHSRNTKKQNQKLIEDFNSGVIDSLYSCQMTREGQNYKNIEVGVLIQLDAGDLYNIQRIGRVVRSAEPVIYLLIVEGTQDTRYLNTIKEIIEPKYFKIENI